MSYCDLGRVGVAFPAWRHSEFANAVERFRHPVSIEGIAPEAVEMPGQVWAEARNELRIQLIPVKKRSRQKPPGVAGGLLSAIEQIEADEPAWKDRKWVVEESTWAFRTGLEKKGIGGYPEHEHRSRIEKMVAGVDHPYMVSLILNQILRSATTAAQAIEMMDEIMDMLAARQARQESKACVEIQTSGREGN